MDHGPYTKREEQNEEETLIKADRSLLIVHRKPIRAADYFTQNGTSCKSKNIYGTRNRGDTGDDTMLSFYVTLGVFLLLAVRAPVAHWLTTFPVNQVLAARDGFLTYRDLSPLCESPPTRVESFQATVGSPSLSPRHCRTSASEEVLFTAVIMADSKTPGGE